jgi:hypothetical protein
VLDKFRLAGGARRAIDDGVVNLVEVRGKQALVDRRPAVS